MPGGTIVTLGSASRAPLAPRGRNLLVARLQADGSPDPTFAGGEPLALPADAGAGDLAVRADGGVVVSDFGHVTTIGADGAAGAAHVRVGPTSALTPLVNTAGGVVLVRLDDTHIAALGADGTVGPPVTLDPGFGGFVGNTPPLRERLSPLPRATYQGALLRLASGAFLGYGTIGLVDRGVTHPATPGHTSIAAIALAGFGPDMLPDPTFGGPPTPLAVAAVLHSHRRSYARHHRKLDVEVSLSAPATVRIVVRAGATLISQRLAGALVTGSQRMIVPITNRGAQLLAHSPSVVIRASVVARDMIGNLGRASADGRAGLTPVGAPARAAELEHVGGHRTLRAGSRGQELGFELGADQPTVVVAAHVDHPRAGARADDPLQALAAEQQRDAVVGGVAGGQRAVGDRRPADRQPGGLAVDVHRQRAGQEAEARRRRRVAERARDAPLEPAHRARAEPGEHDAGLPASRRIMSSPSARQTASRPSIEPPPT